MGVLCRNGILNRNWVLVLGGGILAVWGLLSVVVVEEGSGVWLVLCRSRRFLTLCLVLLGFPEARRRAGDVHWLRFIGQRGSAKIPEHSESADV